MPTTVTAPWPDHFDSYHPDYVYIQGSHGLLECDRYTGNVITYYASKGSDEDGYEDIVRIDPDTYRPRLDHAVDILSVGFWTADGDYTVGMIWDPEGGRWPDGTTHGDWRENPYEHIIKRQKEADFAASTVDETAEAELLSVAYEHGLMQGRRARDLYNRNLKSNIYNPYTGGRFRKAWQDGFEHSYNGMEHPKR